MGDRDRRRDQRQRADGNRRDQAQRQGRREPGESAATTGTHARQPEAGEGEQPDGDRRHLPVPVDPGVERPDAGEGDHGGVELAVLAAHPPRQAGEDRHQAAAEEQQPDDPQLAEHLGVEVVGVDDDERLRPAQVPLQLVGASAGAS